MKPHKIKNSKFNAIGQDPISEMTYGEGAVALNDCRIIIRDGGSEYIKDKKVTKTGLFGVAINTPNMVNGDECFQMWDCDIIIIPRKKYRKGFSGIRTDQILCNGNMGNPEMWEEEIFNKDDNE